MNSKTRSNAFLHCITAVGALLLALAMPAAGYVKKFL